MGDIITFNQLFSLEENNRVRHPMKNFLRVPMKEKERDLFSQIFGYSGHTKTVSRKNILDRETISVKFFSGNR